MFPAFLAAIIFIGTSLNVIQPNATFKVFMLIGGFTFMYFILAWAFILLTDKAWWAKKEGLDIARECRTRRKVRETLVVFLI